MPLLKTEKHSSKIIRSQSCGEDKLVSGASIVIRPADVNQTELVAKFVFDLINELDSGNGPALP